jgi:hypothetical protein
VIWDTDGVELIGVSATSSPPCRIVCPAFPVPVVAGALATGLAFDEGRDALWMIDTGPNLSLLRLTATSRCPAPASRCNLATVIPTTHQPGGLAFSERRQLLFYSSSSFATPGANIVYVAPVATPCEPSCRITVFSSFGCGGAPLGPITGLAYDDCADRLNLTDGRVVVRATFVPACGVINLQCCPAALVAAYYGLCLETDHPVAKGKPCQASACAPCPAMQLSAVGDPSLGNSQFGLRLDNGPTGGLAFVLLDGGACGAGAAFLCGLYYPAALPPALILGPTVLGGAGACGGNATQPLPIPMDPTLCGVNLCTQAITLCMPALGLGLTNAIDLRITDS